MGISELFGFKFASETAELPVLFPLSVSEKDFINVDVISLYTKILTDVIERTQGLTDDHLLSLWDNCLASEANDGLITLLAKAMSEKTELFLVYDKSTKVLRKADGAESQQIRIDYKKSASSTVGTFVSFKNYNRTDMIKLYSALEYCTVAGLNKTMNISKAVQIKVNDLRGSTSLADASSAITQAARIATGLKEGKDIICDAKDIIETAKPDLTPIESSMQLMNQKRSFYLGLPASYITGEAPKGLGDTGEGDAKAVERGLKNYFFAIMKPVCEAVFSVKSLTFKSEDFQQITTSLEALKTFELVSGELLSDENKRIIINKLFGLPEETKGDPPEKVEPAPGEGGPEKVPPAKNSPPPPKVAG